MLLFLWSWNGVMLPVVNATAGASIVPIHGSTCLALLVSSLQTTVADTIKSVLER
jgi:hypothetical protein